MASKAPTHSRRLDVVVTRGHRRGRRGYIYGAIASQNPHVTKTLVIFGPEDDALVAFGSLALTARAPAQLELFREKMEPGAEAAPDVRSAAFAE